MKFQTVFTALLLAFPLFAAVERRSLDLKLPSQAILERQLVSAPGASTNNYILTSNAGATSGAAVTVSSFSNQPDVARALSITPGGSTGDVGSCTITVSGTDIAGNSISETFAFTSNQSAAIYGSKAFKTVTSIAFPASCEDSPYNASWIVGVTNTLGLKKCMRNAGNFGWATYNGAYESTRPTVAANSTTLSSNTIVLNTALAGSDVEAFFVQNFNCNP